MKYLIATAASFTGGAIVFAIELFSFPIALFAAAVALALCVLAPIVANTRVLTIAAIMLVSFSLGIAYTAVYQDRALPEDPLAYGTDVSVEGVVVKAEDRERTQHVVVKSETLDTKVLVITGRFPQFSYGDSVHMAGELEKPESFETETGRVFNYPAYLAKDGIHATMLYPGMEQIGTGGGSRTQRFFVSVREWYVETLAEHLPEPQAGLAAGITAGVERALGDDLLDAFRVVGIIHIIVLSGYNVTIVAEVVAKTIGRVLSRRMTLVLSVVGIVLFAGFVGFGATVVRASIMALLVVIAQATHRTYDVLRGLLLAGLAMLLHNPLIAAFDPSFQLSFLATLGLILFSPHLERAFSRIPEFGGIRFIVVATIATQLFVLPLLLAQIGAISLVAPLANIFVLIVVPAAMAASALVAALSFIHPFLALPAVALAYVLLGYIVWVAELFARVPFASVTLPAFSLWWALGLYVLYGFLLYWLWKKRNLASIHKINSKS